MLTASQLDTWLNKSIADICLNGYAKPADNHCAHFVSHAVNLGFGVTCRQLTGKIHFGANVRVQEVFAQCAVVQEIRECNPEMTGLIFLSAPANFVTNGGRTVLNNVPKKHIGFLIAGNVWHYSNSQRRVVKMPISQFIYHYPDQTNALWPGSLPVAARAIHYGQC